jgi:hypothetical protein
MLDRAFIQAAYIGSLGRGIGVQLGYRAGFALKWGRRWSRRRLCRYRARSTAHSQRVDAQLIWHLIGQAQPLLGRRHIGRELSRKAAFLLDFPAILFADHAASYRQALGGMLLHPLRELGRAYQAGLQ